MQSFNTQLTKILDSREASHYVLYQVKLISHNYTVKLSIQGSNYPSLSILVARGHKNVNTYAILASVKSALRQLTRLSLRSYICS